MGSYRQRIIDAELTELLLGLPAISLEGPKGVGKTATAAERGGTLVRLDDSATLEIVHAQPDRLLVGNSPVVIDEWQRYPASWDVIRRAVDAGAAPGRFLLTGSATPIEGPLHSGAGRIVPVRVRPLTLAERGVGTPTVSLAELLTGSRPPLEGTASVNLETYTAAICAGGFPGMRLSTPRAQRAALDGYLAAIVEVDLPELGVNVRNPGALRRVLRAFGAATATTTAYDKIRDAATGGEADKPARTTIVAYRNALERLRILDDVEAWAPTHNHLRRLAGAPKHHLADPALAARLVGLDAGALLDGAGPDSIPRDGTFLGALFESLATLDVRVFAQAAEATIAHIRTQGGEHEIDLVVLRADQRLVAIEVKLSETIGTDDVRHLAWLRERLGPELLDAIVVTTGPQAYRRTDGIGVVPLALLGP
jgi:uncharacterized protein